MDKYRFLLGTIDNESKQILISTKKRDKAVKNFSEYAKKDLTEAVRVEIINKAIEKGYSADLIHNLSEANLRWSRGEQNYKDYKTFIHLLIEFRENAADRKEKFWRKINEKFLGGVKDDNNV